MKHDAQRWTGVASAVYWHCKNLLDGKTTEHLTAGLQSAIKRFINLALSRMNDAEAIKALGYSHLTNSTFMVANEAFKATGLTSTLDEMRALLVEFRALANKLNTDEVKNERAALQKMARFFEQVLRMGETQRYAERCGHGTDDDDD